MPPLTPSRTRAPAYGRWGAGAPLTVRPGAGPDGSRPSRLWLLGAGTALRQHAVRHVPRRELLEGARGQLLLARRRTVAGKLVDDARELRRDDDREVLVGGVLRHFYGRENLHLSLRTFVDLSRKLVHQFLHLLLDPVDPVASVRLRIDD